MAFKKVVLFKIDSFGREVYFDDFDGRSGVSYAQTPTFAMGFPDQRSAYDFGGQFLSLQDWKVGLR